MEININRGLIDQGIKPHPRFGIKLGSIIEPCEVYRDQNKRIQDLIEPGFNPESIDLLLNHDLVPIKLIGTLLKNSYNITNSTGEKASSFSDEYCKKAEYYFLTIISCLLTKISFNGYIVIIKQGNKILGFQKINDTQRTFLSTSDLAVNEFESYPAGSIFSVRYNHNAFRSKVPNIGPKRKIVVIDIDRSDDKIEFEFARYTPLCLPPALRPKFSNEFYYFSSTNLANAKLIQTLYPNDISTILESYIA